MFVECVQLTSSGQPPPPQLDYFQVRWKCLQTRNDSYSSVNDIKLPFRRKAELKHFSARSIDKTLSLIKITGRERST